jgi:hypothetical protein
MSNRVAQPAGPRWASSDPLHERRVERQQLLVASMERDGHDKTNACALLSDSSLAALNVMELRARSLSAPNKEARRHLGGDGPGNRPQWPSTFERGHGEIVSV